VWTITVVTEHDSFTVKAPTPYLALLKALAAQWKVEVEG